MVNLFHILLIWVKQIHVFCHPYTIRLLSSSRCKKKIGFQNTFNKTDVIQYLRMKATFFPCEITATISFIDKEVYLSICPFLCKNTYLFIV